MRGFLITVLVLVVIFGVGIYYWTRDDVSINDEQVFCTLDAKICPDGSYVGRVPPTCEFAACPSAATSGAMMEDGVDANSSIDVDLNY